LCIRQTAASAEPPTRDDALRIGLLNGAP
jgi:hypothetical protein